MKKAMKWVLTALIVLGAVLAIVGISIDFIGVTVGGQTATAGLFDEAFIGEQAESMAKAFVAFSTLTMIFAVLTLVMQLLQAFGIVKTNKIKMLLAVLTVVCAIIAIAITAAYCVDNSPVVRDVKLYETAPAAGAYLMTFGGLIAGIAGLFPVKK